MRSIRDPEWGMRPLTSTVNSADQLGSVLQTILTAAGRELTAPLMPLPKVTAAAMRAAGALQVGVNPFASTAVAHHCRSLATPRQRLVKSPPVPPAHTASASLGNPINF